MHCTGKVTLPSSVKDVEDSAFYGCVALEKVELTEGLQRIERCAFDNCALLRIEIPSTTLKIGEIAFSRCHQLRNVDLREGLLAIDRLAFRNCHALERITIPSSTALIGKSAFENCRNLSEVVLREGVHYIDVDGFLNCTALGRINIPPVALEIDTRDTTRPIQGVGSCQFMRETMPIGVRGRKLIVSKWLQHRSLSQLELAQAKVNEILGRPQETEEEKVRCIREWFAYYYLFDVTTMLELAVWRANMDANERDVEARQAGRRSCGNDMNVIIPCVLDYLEESRGPLYAL